MQTDAVRRWTDLAPRARAGIAVGGAVQLGLLAAALRDLRRRDPAQLRGPRWLWTLLAFVNIVGPLAYFAVGRRRAPR
jgi:Phospholipase_D-nuclease N-terminal